MTKLFVYGTLKHGKRAHGLLEREGAKFIRDTTTSPNHHIYRVGWFPGMIVDDQIIGGVRGELYEVSTECLDNLDRYEGAPHLFRRAIIRLSDGTECVAYLYNHEVEEDARILTGEWQ